MALRTIEEITAEMTAISNLGNDNPLTDEQVSQYEALENELKSVQRTEAIRVRNQAYNTVTYAPGVPARVARSDKSDEVLAFENYIRTGIPNQDISHLRVTNAQGEGVSAAGGFLVPTEFRQKLIEVRKSFGGFLPNVERLNTTTGGPIEYPTNDDTANSGEITPEHDAFASGADLTFGQVNLGAYKYTSMGAGSNLPLRVSVELLQDAAFDIEGLITRKLGMRIHRKQAVDAVTGNGVGRPLGIVASSLTSDRDLDTPDTPDYEDHVELQDLLDEEYDSNAKWLMKRNTWAQLRLLVDLNGRPLIQDASESIQGTPVRRLLGHEVIIDEAMPTLSSAGDTYCIAYGDFREAYIWRTVANLVVVVNPYSRASNGEVEFTAWERADGTVQNRSAYKIMQNNT